MAPAMNFAARQGNFACGLAAHLPLQIPIHRALKVSLIRVLPQNKIEPKEKSQFRLLRAQIVVASK